MVVRGSIFKTAVAGVLISCCVGATAQGRGRKYKAPPPTSHIEVEVVRNSNQKPVQNAAVVFHSIKDGRDEGNLEVKTNDDGKAVIDIIPTGSSVEVQVIANGLATFAQTYQVDEANRSIKIALLSPRAQISAYQDNQGKNSERQWGVQEPVTPATPPVTQKPKSTNHTSDPAPLAPVDPNATPGTSQNQTTGKPSGVPPTL